MSINAIPTTARIAVLKHAIDGRADNFIAGATGLTPAQVLDVKAAHGYPDVGKMDWAVDVLTKQVEGSTPKPAPSTSPRFTPTPTTQRPTVSRPTMVEHREPAQSANELIVAASKSPKKRTQALGVKIAGLLGDLTKALAAEDDAAQERAKAVAADRKRKQRIAELENELRKLKGQKPARPAASIPCPQCDRTFDTPQGMRAHERSAHEGFNPRLVHAARESA